jgi:hypothetical protein
VHVRLTLVIYSLINNNINIININIINLHRSTTPLPSLHTHRFLDLLR